MKYLNQDQILSRTSQAALARFTPVLVSMALAAVLSACSNSANSPTATAAGPQLYMSPAMVGGAGAGVTDGQATYSIDDKALLPTFVQQTYALNNAQTGAQVNYSGDLVTLSRGWLELGISYCNSTRLVSCTAGSTYNPPLTGSGWAVELAGQAGGLLQMTGQPFTPLVPAVTCPSMSTAETFLFVTLPNGRVTSGTYTRGWNPQLETAYGSVDVTASGSTVTFGNINQYILPSEGGGKTPGAPTSMTGACSTTVFGNTVAVPANPTITIDPTGTETITPQAMIGIGPSGLLIEDNNSGRSKAPFYENVLGAGTGAIGLPRPTSTLDTSSLLSAQYQGFILGSGSYDSSRSSSFNWASLPVSFGFPSLPANCSSIAPQTSTMLYGGDFRNNDPSSSAAGYGNCDFAIDLGAPDKSTNGLFPAATVYVGTGFSTNTAGTIGCGLTTGYCFHAVAIAGQLGGKYAIFLIGEDTTGSPNQAWGVYLLQSN